MDSILLYTVYTCHIRQIINWVQSAPFKQQLLFGTNKNRLFVVYQCMFHTFHMFQNFFITFFFIFCYFVTF